MILDPALSDLLIPAGALVKANPDRYDALRVLPARLSVPGRRKATVEVTLELLPWSNSRSDLAVTCTDASRVPLGTGPAQYRDAAEAALEVLGRLMEAGTVRPNRRVSAQVARAEVGAGGAAAARIS